MQPALADTSCDSAIAERRRLARLSDQWADRAVKYGCAGLEDWASACARVADLCAEGQIGPIADYAAHDAARLAGRFVLAAEARAV